MKILITSVGRRAYIVKYFKNAINNNGEVHVSNSDNNSIAFRYANKSVVSPLIYSEEYIPFLIEYCKLNEIDMILSLFDADLPILANNKDKFANIGTKIIVSDAKFINVCNDKWETYNYLIANGFNTPKTYLKFNDVQNAIFNQEVRYPIIVKPRFGCGSISVAVAYDMYDLEYLYKKITKQIEDSYLRYESENIEDKIIFQECLIGQEYGADVINDLEGKHKKVIIRKKIAMRSGETDIAQIVKDISIESVLERLGQTTHHIANLDCDVFLVDEVPYILEMNARFGGGYPFSHMAGCDLPKAIIGWINGNAICDELECEKIGQIVCKEIVLTALGGI